MLNVLVAVLLTVLVISLYMAFPALGEWERTLAERVFGPSQPQDRF